MFFFQHLGFRITLLGSPEALTFSLKSLQKSCETAPFSITSKRKTIFTRWTKIHKTHFKHIKTLAKLAELVKLSKLARVLALKTLLAKLGSFVSSRSWPLGALREVLGKWVASSVMMGWSWRLTNSSRWGDRGDLNYSFYGVSRVCCRERNYIFVVFQCFNSVL